MEELASEKLLRLYQYCLEHDIHLFSIKRMNSHIFNISFLGNHFYADTSYTNSYFYFYVNLINRLATYPKLSYKKENDEYQKFWQYVIEHEFTEMNWFSLQEESIFVKDQIEKLLSSFSEKTRLIYHAIKTLHELKQPS